MSTISSENKSGDKKDIEQKKQDALCSKYLHEKKLHTITSLNTFVDYMVIAVTVLYFPIRYIAKGSEYSNYAEIGWEIFAAILFALSLLKISYKWQERINNHNKLMFKNMNLITQANEILKSNNLNNELFRFFMQLTDTLETEDREALGKLKDEEKRWAYREAIKEQDGEKASCAICQESPWYYKKAFFWSYNEKLCQLCGTLKK